MKKSDNLHSCVICMISAYKHMILYPYDIFAIKKLKILAHTPFLKKLEKICVRFQIFGLEPQEQTKIVKRIFLKGKVTKSKGGFNMVL